MGRLEEIVERNKHPRRHRKGAGMTIGIGLAMFVFLILVLMVFTDLGVPPSRTPEPPETPAPAADDGTRRVRGIQLRSAPSAAPRDAGAPAEAR
jgi:hypothetical protein